MFSECIGQKTWVTVLLGTGRNLRPVERAGGLGSREREGRSVKSIELGARNGGAKRVIRET